MPKGLQRTLRSIAIDNLPFRYQLSEAMQNWILLVSSKGHVDCIFWRNSFPFIS